MGVLARQVVSQNVVGKYTHPTCRTENSMGKSENDPKLSNASRSTPLDYARPAKRRVPRLLIIGGATVGLLALLVVISIYRRSVRMEKTASNLKQIGVAMRMYANAGRDSSFPRTIPETALPASQPTTQSAP